MNYRRAFIDVLYALADFRRECWRLKSSAMENGLDTNYVVDPLIFTSIFDDMLLSELCDYFFDEFDIDSDFTYSDVTKFVMKVEEVESE